MAQMSKIGSHKTSVFMEDGFTKVVYHNTVVVRFNEDMIILDHGGYSSKTTKLRMNQASNQFDLGFNVWQKDFEWFVSYKGKTFEFSRLMVLNRG